jgi:hypothetical protein
MASLVLAGDTSGSITVSAPAVAGSTTQTLVNVTGTLAPVVSGTAVTASSTSVDFTGIPSWVKRITVMFQGVSSNGTSLWQIQIGSGSVTTSGYVASVAGIANVATNSSTGFIQAQTISAATTYTGVFVVNNFSGNTYLGSGSLLTMNNASNGFFSSGSIALGGTLDRVRITTVNGTDTFDAGTINILFE